MLLDMRCARALWLDIHVINDHAFYTRTDRKAIVTWSVIPLTVCGDITFQMCNITQFLVMYLRIWNIDTRYTMTVERLYYMALCSFRAVLFFFLRHAMFGKWNCNFYTRDFHAFSIFGEEDCGDFWIRKRNKYKIISEKGLHACRV